MKKKHYIKIVEDIKYCEENGLTIFSEIQERYYEFHNNVWCSYDENSGDIKIYNCEMFIDDLCLYYYEEESEEPMQEATEADVGKLCLFWDNEERDGERSILKVIHSKELYPYLTEDCNYYVHCRRLSPAEVAEITGYKVEEK